MRKKDMPTAVDNFVRSLQDKLWQKIETFHPSDGSAYGLDNTIKQAFLDTPRHIFLNRFRTIDGSNFLLSEENTDLSAISAAYNATYLIHLDAQQKALPSTNSEPAFILHLIARLDLMRGQRVLEIGSGGGWLVGIMSALVGPEGAVYGVELIKDLASSSRTHLDRLARSNTVILSGDGWKASTPFAPFDRLIVTAGFPTFPAEIFDQLGHDGVAVFPVQVPGGGDEVFIVKRAGSNSFLKCACLTAWFVPLNGDASSGSTTDLANFPAAKSLLNHPCGDFKWENAPHHTPFSSLTFAFRAFLAKVEPRLRLFYLPISHVQSVEAPQMAFGVIDEETKSLVLCRKGVVRGYGSPEEFHRFGRWLEHWKALGQPQPHHFAARAWLGESNSALPEASWVLSKHHGVRVAWSLTPPRKAGWSDFRATLEATPWIKVS